MSRQRVCFTPNAWEECTAWLAEDRNLLKRINQLIEAIGRDPFAGTGKPEPLKHQLSGYWSRRINEEHRLVCRVEGETLVIVQCRYHYRVGWCESRKPQGQTTISVAQVRGN